MYYIMKLLLFSLFSKNGVEKYESGEFKAEGYKEWKLVLYPNRNKSKSEEENICLYLAMTDISSLPLGCEVYVIFLLVLLVQNKGKNLIVQGCYFHNLVTSQYCFVKHVHLICY
ncbi:hypothetical protein CUMW_017080 [Citrus unshiu]|nr:hypothetical protein CUMW_017080 [Citrus unshiu]GAY35568.1 hypothetical protein CUMW_017080 [Citrus unshiu]